MGVLSSLISLAFIMLHPKSDMELKKEEVTEGNFLNKLFFAYCESDGVLEGKDSGREGSSALCRQERRAPMRD